MKFDIKKTKYQYLAGLAIFIVSLVVALIFIELVLPSLLGFDLIVTFRNFGFIEPIVIMFRHTMAVVTTLMGIIYLDRKKINISKPILLITVLYILWAVSWYMVNFVDFR